jgi:GTP cyclohydrolase IB
MTLYTSSVLPDVANETAISLNQDIDQVGMTNIQLPILIEAQKEILKVPSICNIFINLTNTKSRGIHMSRLYNTLVESTQNKPVNLSMISTLLSKLIQSHSKYSSKAIIEFNYDLCLKQKSLLSELPGYRYYPVNIHAEKSLDKTLYKLSFKVLYSSTCPCSAALARQSIKEKFNSDFSGSSSINKEDVSNWINSQSNINATPHAQRSEALITLSFDETYKFSIESLIRQAEKVLATPVQAAVKREDEKEFAKLNAANLMFCEDAVRKLDEWLTTLTSTTKYSIEVNHFESLHSHNATAKILNKKPNSSI